MKKRVLILTLSLILVALSTLGSIPSVVEASPIMKDIETHWGKKYIDNLIEKGGITGYPDGSFKPNNQITKAEFMTIALKSALDGKVSAKVDEHWASGIFKDATDKGVVLLSDFPKTDWDKPINRYEMAYVMVSITEKIFDEAQTETIDVEKIMSDYNKVSQEIKYKYYVEQAFMKGLVTGKTADGQYDGVANGTRAEAAAMVVRMLDKSIRKKVDTTKVITSTIEFTDAGPIAKIIGDVAFTNKVIGGEGDGEITYVSGTPKTATVDKETGKVTIVAVGTTVITASKEATKTHSAVTNTYTINVSKTDPVSLTSMGNIIGEAKVGATLTAGSVSPKEATVNYAWLMHHPKRGDWEYIPGATTNKYTIAPEYGRYRIRVEVTGTGNYKGTITSESTSSVVETIVITDPIVNKAVAATAVNAGQTLAQSTLSGTFKNSNGQAIIGTLEWQNPSLVLTSTSTNSWRFVPNDINSYNWIQGTVGVTVAASQTSDFAGGTGTVADPYLVANADQLNNVRKYLDKNFKQTTNIDLSTSPWNDGEGWVPIGYDNNLFSGTYNGNGQKIWGLTINRPNDTLQGLFYNLSTNGKLMNISLNEVNINAKNDVAGLVPYNFGTIQNCSVTGAINCEGTSGGLVAWNGDKSVESISRIENSNSSCSVSGMVFVGGLVGANYGNIVKSFATGSIKGDHEIGGLVGVHLAGTIDTSYATGVVSGNYNIGGLVGRNHGLIISSNATGKVSGDFTIGGLVGDNYGDIKYSNATGTITGNYQIGGLVGDNSDIIESSYATGSVEGTETIGGLVGRNMGGTICSVYATGSVEGTDDVGGLLGNNEGSIEDSYAIGAVKGDNKGKGSVGGLVGVNHVSIIRCYAAGSVYSEANNVGGLAGYNLGYIDNSYAKGQVKGKNNVGGLVGINSQDGIIRSCYAIGFIGIIGDNYKDYIGGIVGLNNGGITCSYYDKQTTGRDDTGKGNPKKTAEMVKEDTFKNWDFVDVWNIDSNSYPYLRWQK